VYKRAQKGPNRHQADCLGHLNVFDFESVYDLMHSSEAMSPAAQTSSSRAGRVTAYCHGITAVNGRVVMCQELKDRQDEKDEDAKLR
jgi:hypothetical protein